MPITAAEGYLPCKNIKIIGNKFINTSGTYAISIKATQGITIKDNVFEKRPDDTIDGKYCKAVYLNGCANINISDNTFSEIAQGDVTKAVVGVNYVNLYGTDIVDSEGNRFLPENNVPQS